jgi:hypothetical protein
MLHHILGVSSFEVVLHEEGGVALIEALSPSICSNIRQRDRAFEAVANEYREDKPLKYCEGNISVGPCCPFFRTEFGNITGNGNSGSDSSAAFETKSLSFAQKQIDNFKLTAAEMHGNIRKFIFSEQVGIMTSLFEPVPHLHL